MRGFYQIFYFLPLLLTKNNTFCALVMSNKKKKIAQNL